MVEDLGAADGGGRRGFQAELRPRKAEELVSALLAGTKEIPGRYSIPARYSCIPARYSLESVFWNTGELHLPYMV